METVLKQRQQQSLDATRKEGFRPSKLINRSTSTIELSTSSGETTHFDTALQNLCSALRELQQHLLQYSDDDGDEENKALILPDTRSDTNYATVAAVPSKNQNDFVDERNAITMEELIGLCSKVQASTYLEPIQLVRAIVDAAALPNEAQQQAALFDVFGSESDEAMQVLIDVGSKLSDRKSVV